MTTRTLKLMPHARLGGGLAAGALLALLLAACAGSDGGLVAEAPWAGPAAPPVKARPVRTAAPAPTGRAIATGSIARTKADNLVDLPYRPAVGSRWVATTEMRDTKSSAGRVTESTIVRDRGEFRIVQKLEKGYRIAYTLHDGTIEGNTPVVELMRPLIQSMKGQSFAYEADDAGVPTRVLDVDRWKGLAVKAVDMMAESKPEFSSVPQLQQFIASLRSRYEAATPESGVELFLEPVVRYTMVQGLTNATVGDERSYDDEAVHPLTGTRMRAKGSFKVIAVDRAKGLATIEWRLTISPEDLNKATRDLIMRFAPEGQQDAQQKVDEAMAAMKVDHLDRATYKVALADGVVRRMDRTAVVKAQGFEKKTVLVMTMNPAR